MPSQIGFVIATQTADTPKSSSLGRTPAVQAPINLEHWIEENRGNFKPPVSNRYLYDGRDFFVMVIKGPNARNDFHLVDSEEYFYQLKGDIKVRVREGDASWTTLSEKAKHSSSRRMCRTRHSGRRIRLVSWLSGAGRREKRNT